MFGEESDQFGICDVSRERNELDLSKYEFDLIPEEIKSELSNRNPDAEELVKLIDYPKERVIKVRCSMQSFNHGSRGSKALH